MAVFSRMSVYRLRRALSNIDDCLLFGGCVIVPDKLLQIIQSPWQRMHVNFANSLHGLTYLLVVDSHSKWSEIFHMGYPTASCRVRKLRQVFSRFGVSEVIISDNGTLFTSAIFSEFLSAGRNQSCSITHIPYSIKWTSETFSWHI